MNKILKKLLVFVLALGAAIVPFTTVVAADTEEEGIMKEEYIVGTVNAGCVIDAYGDNNKNAVKIQPSDNGFAGVWLALPGLQAKKRAKKSISRRESALRRKRFTVILTRTLWITRETL